MDKLKHPINLEKMTAEQSIQATIDMWTDMLDTLGEDPGMNHRISFKEHWLFNHGYMADKDEQPVDGNCFLCEYAAINRVAGVCCKCDRCPICWPTHAPYHYCKGSIIDYRKTPIPDILAFLTDKKNWSV